MKITLSWLESFLDLQERKAESIAAVLTERSAEVERLEDQAANFKHVVVGQIESIAPHPNADKIQITQTRVAENETLQILCGAKNIAVGQKVPVAKVGAKLPCGLQIEKRKIRGELSCGMICSKAELGLEQDSSGIFILPEDCQVGEDFAAASNLQDVVFEIDNTAITNRPDLFSQLGFAREFVATGLAKWKKTGENFLQDLEKSAAKVEGKRDFGFQINFQKKDLCATWCGVEIENLQIEDSPAWLQEKLIACGVRPISNIVDVTNFVMLELGMPMHAFDASKFDGDKLNFRESRKGERITTLDGQEFSLPAGAIVLEDEQKIFDLCGIMGGANSEISPSTGSILLHAPIFNKDRVRAASLALRQKTDAATIFEKGVCPDLALPAVVRACQLILQICPQAKIASKIVKKENQKFSLPPISLPKSLVEKIMGQEISSERIVQILQDLGFGVGQTGKDFQVQPPSFRPDVKGPEDLVEEIVRIFGLNEIAEKAPESFTTKIFPTFERKLQKLLAQTLVEQGFVEVLNFSFLSEKLLASCHFQVSPQTVEVANPISGDLQFMRESLLPGLLKNAQANSRFADGFRLFEIGRTFEIRGKGEKVEKMQAASILLGEDFAAAKAVLESFFGKMHWPVEFCFAEKRERIFSERCAQVLANGKAVGQVGEIAPDVCQNFDLKGATAFCLNEQFFALRETLPVFKKLPRFPGVSWDVSVLAPAEKPVAEILQLFAGLDEQVTSVKVLEIFTGKGVASGEKSVTLSFQFLNTERTLTENDVQALQAKIEAQLAQDKLKKRFA